MSDDEKTAAAAAAASSDEGDGKAAKGEKAAAAAAGGGGDGRKAKRKKSKPSSVAAGAAAAAAKEVGEGATEGGGAAGSGGGGAAAAAGLEIIDPMKDTDAATLSTYDKGQRPFSATKPDAELPVRLSKSGLASEKPETVPEVFARCVDKMSSAAALRCERDGAWRTWTWYEYMHEVRRTARALIHLGLQPHESVNIIGFNSPEWLFANCGAIFAGGKAAGIYTTNQTDACKYIAEHSEARVVVCEDEKQLKKFLPLRGDALPKLKALVVYSQATAPDGANDGSAAAKAVPTYGWDEFIALGDEVADAVLNRRIAAQRPGHACTLIYTSGTTGNPKAVMISHDNATWTPKTMFDLVDDTFGRDEEHIISYLPLSHVAAQMLDIHMPMALVANRGGRAVVHFARPDALRGSLGGTLKAVRPTVFFGVPRVWEKMAVKIQEIGAQTGGIKKIVGAWAKARLGEGYEEAQVGKSHKLPFGYATARNMLGKVKLALGLDRAKLCMTGAAPIQADTLRYFGSLGLEIYELYGMSESTGPQCVSSPGRFKVGSCGPPLQGCPLRLFRDPSRDRDGEGEICFRGRHIMMGYMKNDEKTAEAIDPDGWLHSGDVGRVDEHGFLHITGRIKELIITAGGENVAPVPMEDAVKERLPGVQQIMMVGDKRKMCAALITLWTEEDGDTITTKLAARSLQAVPSSKATTTTEAADCAEWKKYIDDGIAWANKERAVSNASTIKKWLIVENPFSVQRGELTPTLKLKRPIVHRHYADEIESIYAEGGGGGGGGGAAGAAGGDKKKGEKKAAEKKAAEKPAAAAAAAAADKDAAAPATDGEAAAGDKKKGEKKKGEKKPAKAAAAADGDADAAKA